MKTCPISQIARWQKVKTLQSEMLTHATRSEILTQHDDVEFMQESDRNHECVVVIDKLLISHLKKPAVFNEKFREGTHG